ncbi:uncharacterized protein LOC107364882 [Tetranychus urticae]|uniref:uncharacterized protein LOC107364882 n=1 Tax=Tetranychus urticae TaxID=32264 RepID=UPI00077B88DE|nr:uncharacterized protein LOC107364882 [Tetranychus urticae]
MAKKEKTILDLNEDVMFEILAHITNIREVLRLKSVCKRFDFVVTKYVNFCPIKIMLPRHIYYPAELVLPRKMVEPRSHRLEIYLIQILSNCKRLSQLNTVMFTNFVWWSLSNLDGPLPSLVNLDVRTSHPTLSNLALNTLLRKCINLERLGLWEFSRLNINLNYISSTITHLEIKNHSSDAAVLRILQSKGQQLKHLRIENSKFNTANTSRVDKISNENLHLILAYCPNLECLNLINYIMPGDLGCITGLKNFKQIVLDSPKSDYRFSNSAVIQILLNNPGLTHLTIPIPISEFLEFIRTCQMYCPTLQYLDSLTIQLYDEITMDAIMKIWARFLNLYELNKCTKHKFLTSRKQTMPFGI